MDGESVSTVVSQHENVVLDYMVPSLRVPSFHPTPHTLHPTPHTLHPTPYTPHPTPYALRPKPYAP
jgi:hypothetical protein